MGRGFLLEHELELHGMQKILTSSSLPIVWYCEKIMGVESLDRISSRSIDLDDHVFCFCNGKAVFFAFAVRTG